MRRHILTSIVMLIGVTLVLGFGYPLVVTGLSQLLFHNQANGSLIYKNGKLTGSALLGQSFTDSAGNPLPQWFQPRPSAGDYDGADSGASNLGPSNALLIGFVAGVNTVGLGGQPSAVNPFATPADPACVPMSTAGVPITSPAPGDKYEMTDKGTYKCDPNTVPERSIAYRLFNHLAPSTPVPVDAVTASASGLDPDISVQNALDQAARVASARGLPDSRVLALVRQRVTPAQLGFLSEPVVNVLELNLALEALQ
jgi:K+-transporting ATPase ATPase C chain